MSDDRTVHAAKRGIEIVRYDKAGKWYVEIAADYGRVGLPAERIPVTVEEAADRAREWWMRGDGDLYLGRPGGKRFDFLIAGTTVSPADTTEAG